MWQFLEICPYKEVPKVNQSHRVEPEFNRTAGFIWRGMPSMCVHREGVTSMPWSCPVRLRTSQIPGSSFHCCFPGPSFFLLTACSVSLPLLKHPSLHTYLPSQTSSLPQLLNLVCRQRPASLWEELRDWGIISQCPNLPHSDGFDFQVTK